MPKDYKKEYKSKLDFLARRVYLQQQKMEQAIERFITRDKAIFARITDAMSKHDTARQNVFTNELVEVRKMLELIIKCKVAIENVYKILSTQEQPDLVQLATVVGVLNTVRFDLSCIFPESENEIGDICNFTSGILVGIAIEKQSKLDFEVVATSIKDVLEKSATETKKQITDKFPSIP